MARAPRVEYLGAVYHVMARGDCREAIVRDDRDRELFVDTLFEAVLRAGWDVYAWVLMDNHYHLALKTPQANLVAGMSWFQTTFTRRINLRQKLWGHVFGGRYKSVLVESEERSSSGRWQDYLVSLIDYIHLNPARAGLVDGSTRPIESFRWSSVAQGYLLMPSKRPEGLAVETGLELLGCRDDAAGRSRFAERLNARARQERLMASREGLSHPAFVENLNQTLQRGWCWGSEAFRERIREEFADEFEGKGDKNRPLALRSASARDPEFVLLEAAQHFGIAPAELSEKRARGDWSRAAIAWSLARRTTAKQAWIAEKLGLGTAANVSQLCRRFMALTDLQLPVKEREWRARWG